MNERERQAFTRALSTMKAVVSVLVDEPDPDGVLGRLAARIDGERAWVLAEMVLGQRPQRPPSWLRRERMLVHSEGPHRTD